MALKPGTRLGAYEIINTLGAGSMGEVYRALDPRLGRDVAIKIMSPQLAKDAEWLRRFQPGSKFSAVRIHAVRISSRFCVIFSLPSSELLIPFLLLLSGICWFKINFVFSIHSGLMIQSMLIVSAGTSLCLTM